MIQLAINNTFLDTDAKLSISIKEAFAFDEFLSIPGEHSWKFSLPKTPTNRRAFGFSDTPVVAWNPRTSFACTIYVDMMVYKTGSLYIERDSATTFSVYFVGAIGELKSLFAEKTLKELGWSNITGIGNMFDYAETVAADNTSYDVVFPPIASPDESVYLTRFYAYNALAWLEDPVGTFSYDGYDQSDINLLIPCLYFRKIWAQIESYFGITIKGEILDDAEINTLFLFNTHVINKLDANGDYTNTFETEIILEDHVPEVTITNFILSFCQLFNQYASYDLDSKTLLFTHRKDLPELPRVLWTEKVVDYYTNYETFKTVSLRYEYNKDDLNYAGYLLWAGTLQGVDGPEGSEVVNSSMSTLPMAIRTISGSWKAPVTSARPDTDVKLKVLFYRGIRYGSSNSFIDFTRGPYASSDNLNVQYPVDYALLWQGTGNLKETFWDAYINRVLEARRVVVTLKLTPQEIKAFNPLRVYVIDGWKCLVRKLEYSISENETLVEAEVLKIS